MGAPKALVWRDNPYITQLMKPHTWRFPARHAGTPIAGCLEMDDEQVHPYFRKPAYPFESHFRKPLNHHSNRLGLW